MNIPINGYELSLILYLMGTTMTGAALDAMDDRTNVTKAFRIVGPLLWPLVAFAMGVLRCFGLAESIIVKVRILLGKKS